MLSNIKLLLICLMISTLAFTQKTNGNKNLTAEQKTNAIDLGLIAEALKIVPQSSQSKNRNYEENLADKIRLSKSFYDSSLKSVTAYKGLFEWTDLYRLKIRALNPSLITSNYANNSQNEDAEQLHKKLNANNAKLKEYLITLSKEIEQFKNNPNKLVEGYYRVYGVVDYKYNEEIGEYVETHKLKIKEKDSAYLFFDSNIIVFKRPNEKPKQALLRYDKYNLETANYVLRDGWGQVITFQPNANWVNYFHEADTEKNQYLNYTSYLLLRKTGIEVKSTK